MTITYREKITYEVYDDETGNIIFIYPDEVSAASHAGILNDARRLKEANEQAKGENGAAGAEPASVPGDGEAEGGSGGPSGP